MSYNPFHSPRIREAWEYRSEPEALQTLANIFWRTLLLLALVVFLLALWFGSQELAAASQAESVTAPAAPAKPPLDPAQLQATLAAFSARQSAYETLSGSPPPQVADPSK